MRLSLRTRQVAGVTLIVGLSMAALSAMYLMWIARSSLQESLARGELLARTIFQQAGVAVRPDDPYGALRADPGVRSILEAGIAYSPDVTYAAITDTSGLAVAHSTPVLEGQHVAPQARLVDLLDAGPVAHLKAIYSDRTFEVREPLLMGTTEFGSIRVGMSMLLVRDRLQRALTPLAGVTLTALIVATLGAMAFARWILRPIHVLNTGLTRLGRGEFDVKLELPPGQEFADLGRSFNTVSAELASVRTRLAGQTAQAAHLESLADRLEDAVMMVGPKGEVLFVNPAMRAAMGGSAPALTSSVRYADLLPDGHPYRRVIETALSHRASQGPVSVHVPQGADEPVEHLLNAHAITDAQGRFMGVMFVARNVAYLTKVQSTIRYSQKLASLGRLLAGVAHEVKNPLNAMTIHLELMKAKLSGQPSRRRGAPARADTPGLATAASRGVSGETASAGYASASAAADPPPGRVAPVPIDAAGVLQHAHVIGQEIRRLDEVVQGFLKFSRPEEIKLRPVDVRSLLDDVMNVVGVEAAERHLRFQTSCPPGLPQVNADAAMLRQALLNLALNACQAMQEGGTLTLGAQAASPRHVQITVADTGVGIPPDHLERIFDLYFTTKERGSGIGLSMVYRTIQLHDGTIEVESTPGRGTTFRILLPQA